ncbi:MAG: HlyD family efflux transporter periplasmic adaptor subunit [Rubrivivax sp.]|nr:MAG: HlyD family efflux transporter periplasmic adaptor subunit [Rubrivivax sp.]
MGMGLPVNRLKPAEATAPPEGNPALRLLQHEAEIRRLGTEAELLFHLTHAVQQLVRHDQAMVLRRHATTERLNAEVVSNLPSLDRSAPLVQETEARFHQLDQGGLLAQVHVAPPELWLPLKSRDGRTDAGVVFQRSEPFSIGEQTLLARLADTYAHAWSALRVPARGFTRGVVLNRRRLTVAGGLLLAVSCIPVRLNVMAPVEVVAAEPFVLTSPIAGVVRHILVDPNTPVNAGQVLVQFEDLQPRNDMALAQQKLAVAQARDAKVAAASFKDATAAHDLATAQAELELARVSHNYALEVLQRTQVSTPTAGVVVYTDKRDWEGRPVMVGEEILQVADPAKVAYRVDLPTGNSIALETGAEVKVYLDSAPLGGLQAKLSSISYTPRTPAGGNGSSYTVMAQTTDGQTPRIGSRGTAQLYGGHVPLIVQVLRRPIAATRQFIGW